MTRVWNYIAGIVVLFAAAESYAEEVPCPPVIGAYQSGTYFRKGSLKKFPFQCFREPVQAKKKGYKSLATAKRTNFQGWWRLSLKVASDSCGNREPNTAGPVLFLQVSQKGSAVFGDYCPSVGRISGLASDGSLSLSGTEVVNEIASLCDSSSVERHQLLQLSGVIAGAKTFHVKYSISRRCTSANEGEKACVTLYEGIAFPETHRFWPDVDPNIESIPAGCNEALKRCELCHESFKDLPQMGE